MIPVRFGQDNPSRFDRLCEGVIEAGWLLALLITPIYFLAFSDRPFDPSKSSVIRVLAAVAGAAWVTKVLAGGRPWRPTRKPNRLARPLLVCAALAGGVMLVSTALSPDPRMSWAGSWDRSLGSSTELAVLILFFLVVGHLRTHEQLERILAVVWWTSVPVCLFALLQTLGLDPIAPRHVPIRPSSTLGNPIFLGAYLGIAWFHSLGLISTFLRRPDTGGWAGLRQGAIIAISGLQLWALVASSSRGPALGTVAGLAIVVAFLVITGLRSDLGTASSGRWRRGLTMVLLVLCAAVSIPLIRSTAQDSGPSRGRAPRVASGSHLTTGRTGTIQVRLILWRSAADAFFSSVPISAAETDDGLHRWRPWIGYGRAATVFPMSRHVPLKMSRFESARAPDQTHNVVLQNLLSGGVVGIGAWVLIQAIALTMGAMAVGTLPDRRSVRHLAAVMIAGSTLGALTPRIILDDWLFSVPGGVAGALVGLTLWLLHRWWSARDRPGLGQWHQALLGAIIFAAWVSHLVEVQFGFEVATTMVYSWITLAVLTVTASGWLDLPTLNRPPGEGAGRFPGISIVAGLFTALLLYVFGIDRCHTPDVLLSEPQSQLAAWWIILVSVAVGLALVESRAGAASVGLGFGAGAVGSFVAVQHYHHVVEAAGKANDVPAQIAAVIDAETALAGAGLFLIVSAAVAWGRSLSREPEPGDEHGGRTAGAINCFRVRAVGFVGLAIVVAVWLHETHEIGVSHLARGAKSLAATHRFAAGLDMIERARTLRAAEPRLALQHGRIALDWALAARDREIRDRSVSAAGIVLEEALELAPYDADHVANLGRWYILAAGAEPESIRSDEQIDAGIRKLERALVMRPGAVEWYRELAITLQRRGDVDAAAAVLDPVVRALPDNVSLLVELADLYLELGRQALAAGDARLAHRSMDEAERLGASAAAIDPENRRAREILEGSRALASGGGV